MIAKLLLNALAVLLLQRTIARRQTTYIDPGSGSFLIQILIAAVVGSLLTLRLWWTGLVHFLLRFRRGPSRRPDTSSRADADEAGDHEHPPNG